MCTYVPLTLPRCCLKSLGQFKREVEDKRQTNAKKTKCGINLAMQVLDKSEGAIRKGVERNQIPHRRLGRQIFFSEEELFEFLESAPGLTLDEIRRRVEP